MVSAPATPWLSNSRPATKWQVRLGVRDGSIPDAADETEVLRNPVIRIMAGAEPDEIAFAYDLGKAEQRLQDLETPAGWSRQVEVAQATEEPDEFRLLAAGELLAQEISLAPDGEAVQVTAKMPPWWFGAPVLGPTYLFAEEGEDSVPTVLHDELVFNPLVDGRIENNRSSAQIEHEDPATDWYVWLHPESARTSAALTNAQGGVTRSAWVLKDAVKTLCFAANPDEESITNPTDTELAEIFSGTPITLKNVKLPTGKYLPELLDGLLKPHGYWWFLAYDYDAEEDGARRIKIKIFKLNAGIQREVRHVAPGKRVLFANSNANRISAATSLLEMANEITCLGAFVEREITVELSRTWPSADDSQTPAALNKATGTSYATKWSVWRKWCANEAGDYVGVRGTDLPALLDLSTVFDDTDKLIPKRRPLSDPLTQDRENAGESAIKRRQPFIQYSIDAGVSWLTVPGEWGPQVLENELGVLFTADEPPAELIAAGDDARVRITGTIRGDKRLETTAARQAASALGGTMVLTLDLSDKFFARQVITTGDYASVLAGVPTADERDDLAAMETYAGKIRDVEDAALVRAQIVLFGLHQQYGIGDVITRVAGRNISFNRKSTDAATKWYLQVIGLAHDYAAQTTELLTQAVEEEVLA